MDPEVVQRFLDQQREQTPEDLQQDFLNIEDYWDRKLWHQLTGLLVNYFNNPASSPQRLTLFKHFVLSFSDKINQLKFVALGLAAATQCEGARIDTFHINGVIAKDAQMITNGSASSRTSQKKSTNQAPRMHMSTPWSRGVRSS